MQTTMTIHSDFDISAGRRIQEKLAAFGVVSAFYDANGTCVMPGTCFMDAGAQPHSPADCQYSDLWQGEGLSGGELEALAGGTYCRERSGLHCVRLRPEGSEEFSFFYYVAGSHLNGEGRSKLLVRLVESLLSSYLDNAQQQKEIDSLAATLTRRYEELHLLHQITGEMKFSQKPHVYLQRLCKEILEVVSAQEVAIVWKPSRPGVGERYFISSGHSLWLTGLEDSLWSCLGEAMSHPCGLIMHIRGDAGRFAWPQEVDDVLIVPICQSKELAGGIVSFNKQNADGFDSMDAKLLLSTANEIASYLENVRLYDNLEELFIGSLKALTSSIDAKDPYTCGHSERVARLSRMIAEQMKLSEPEVNHVYLTGLLHDIGKIGVGETVLRKPGRLTEQEFSQIKKHPALGSAILHGIRQMHGIAEGVLSHHERYDGRGYPNGLHGSHIPLAGRIIMLADSYDAMTSDRPYQSKRSIEQAREEIERCQGSQFDPKIAGAFLEIDPTLVSRVVNGAASSPAFEQAYELLLS